MKIIRILILLYYNNEMNQDVIYYCYNNEKNLSTNLSEFHHSLLLNKLPHVAVYTPQLS